ncbi:hypothetical protein [Paenibacillus montanisoli]|uniref:Uncharacterized protein n=1 Tax=Paenibacillus montanisoli TaxID=2081970 RepID=A0A328U8U1_9BACL|nr:hypothetical protein [Paenibacillus montanisoli]RAP77325.1 hypothetical protein DL346_02180 [Paenibacillus montanisoli]
MKSSTINLIGAGIAIVIIGSAAAWGLNKIHLIAGAAQLAEAAAPPADRPIKVPQFTYEPNAAEGRAVGKIEEFHWLFDSNLLDGKIKSFDNPKAAAWTALMKEPAFNSASYTKIGTTLGSIEGLQMDMSNLAELAKIANHTHDPQALVYMHRILHDLDYWAFPDKNDQSKSDDFFGVTETAPAQDAQNRDELGAFIADHQNKS